LAGEVSVHFPLSLWNIKDLLHERCIEVSHETVGVWWQRFDSMFASEIRKREMGQMRALSDLTEMVRSQGAR
jgi:putative transposase